MSNYIKSVVAFGLHSRFNLPKIMFQNGVNILHGKNGTGKTTLLHILANILNGDYRRFAYLQFRAIEAVLDDETRIRVQRRKGLKKEGSTIQVIVNGAIAQTLQVDRIIEEDETERRSRSDRLSSSVQRQISLFDQQPEPVLEAAYFPAFRTMIEAWTALREDRYVDLPARSSDYWKVLATLRAREWFGNFVPIVNFPSLVEIENELARQIESARAQVWRRDRNLLTKAFLDIFRALSTPSGQETTLKSEHILAEIKKIYDRLEQSPLKAESVILTEIYGELRNLIYKSHFGDEAETSTVRVLDVYRRMLADIADVQERSFESIKLYLSTVNDFLDGKSIVVNPEFPEVRARSIGVRFSDNTYTAGLRVLSSGERQIVTLMYAATHMSKQRVVLIDEPEISLHVDWQSPLLTKMEEQLGNRQIIACTHSPIVGEKYEDRLIKLVLAPVGTSQNDKNPTQQPQLLSDDEDV